MRKNLEVTELQDGDGVVDPKNDIDVDKDSKDMNLFFWVVSYTRLLTVSICKWLNLCIILYYACILPIEIWIWG